MALFSLGSFTTSGVIDVNLESSSVSCFFLFACRIWFLFHLEVNNANRHIPTRRLRFYFSFQNLCLASKWKSRPETWNKNNQRAIKVVCRGGGGGGGVGWRTVTCALFKPTKLVFGFSHNRKTKIKLDYSICKLVVFVPLRQLFGESAPRGQCNRCNSRLQNSRFFSQNQ